MCSAIVKHKNDHFVPKALKWYQIHLFFLFLSFISFAPFRESNWDKQLSLWVWYLLKTSKHSKKHFFCFLFFSFFQTFSCVCLLQPFVFIATVDNIETVRAKHFSALFTLDGIFFFKNHFPFVMSAVFELSNVLKCLPPQKKNERNPYSSTENRLAAKLARCSLETSWNRERDLVCIDSCTL